jgi:hypothetical protein
MFGNKKQWFPILKQRYKVTYYSEAGGRKKETDTQKPKSRKQPTENQKVN